MFVFNEREAHVVVAVVAEADARRHCHLGVEQQLLGELQRLHLGVGLGDRRPDEHGGLGRLHLPAHLVEALDQGVAPLAVHLADIAHAVLGAFQGGDGRHLDGREGTVVVVALDARQGGAQALVADHEAHPPARHVVALGQGEEFHRHVLGALHLHDGGGLVAVEDDVGVGDVVHHQDAVLLRHGHHLLEEFEFHALGGGVGREVQDEHLRLRPMVADGRFHFLEEVHPRRHRDVADVRAGDDRAVDVDGVAGVGHQHDVAPVQGRQRQVGDAFLGADGDDGLLLRVEVHAVAGLVPVADGLAQAWDALRQRVAVGVAAPGGLDHLFDDVRRRGLVRIAHAEVDDVLAPPPGGHLQVAGDVEDVGRQPLDSRKFFHC